jgi:prepilin-type N-terminal cleavage/methylation domain-containing protein
MKISSREINPSKQGFTLIELLIVIAIIAVLASLLMPAASNALNAAKKTTAKNQAVQIATAITAYEAEYGCLPAFTGSNMSANNTAILCSTNSSNNPRGIIFLEAQSWKNGKGGTNAAGFCDPFSASSTYYVALDTNYANTISVPVQSTPGSAVTNSDITKHVGVWTVWTNKSKPYIINSWD